MKFSILALSSSLISTSFACLRLHGTVVHDSRPNFPVSMSDVQAIDNGQVVCDLNWGSRTDQDNNFSINCLPGFIYAFRKDGKYAWFRNSGGQAWGFIQPGSEYAYDCGFGPCDFKRSERRAKGARALQLLEGVEEATSPVEARADAAVEGSESAEVDRRWCLQCHDYNWDYKMFC